MKAIIAAGGYGTRMLPVTKTVPKELLPVWNKPVIQYIVEWVVGTGVQDIVMITSQGKSAIEDYFDKNYELEEVLHRKGKTQFLDEINNPKDIANICFVRQKQQLGFPHAVLYAQPWIDSQFFLLSVWDTVFHPQIFQEAMDLHLRTQAGVVVCKQIPHEEVFRYGVVEKNTDGIITSMLEKPDPSETTSSLIQAWIYILPTAIFDMIREMPYETSPAEIALPDVMLRWMQHNDLYACVTQHGVRDTGNPEAWLRACNELQNGF